MSKIAERIYDRFFAQKRKGYKRQHAAAKVNRLNDQWTVAPETANYALRLGIKILRARARQMCGDAPHFKKYLSMHRRNIIGKDGIRLQCRAMIGDKQLNRPLNKRVEEAFKDWGRRETCTASGRMTLNQAGRLFVTSRSRDGEALIQKISQKPTPQNPYGFTLKFIDVSYLDEMYNDTLPNGNRVIMSVEVDDNNRAVAYWLTTPSTDILFSKRQVRTRVTMPADQMIHSFLVFDDESQVRGMTDFHAALLQGKHLYSYIEGVVTSARMAAMSMGIIEEEFPDEGAGYVGPEDSEGRKTLPEINWYPGAFTKLEAGQTFKQFDPKQPTQNHSEFKKSMEIDLASALDVPYFSLTGDMEAVNYSSARVGLEEERAMWRDLQDFTRDEFYNEVFHAWLPNAVMSGALQLSPEEYKQILNPKWITRGWPYIDPQKEVKATLDAIAGGILNYTDHFAAQGKDLVEFLETKRSEKEMFEEYGVPYGVPDPTQLGPAPEETNDEETDDETKQLNAGESDDEEKRRYTNGHDFREIVN